MQKTADDAKEAGESGGVFSGNNGLRSCPAPERLRVMISIRLGDLGTAPDFTRSNIPDRNLRSGACQEVCPGFVYPSPGHDRIFADGTTSTGTRTPCGAMRRRRCQPCPITRAGRMQGRRERRALTMPPPFQPNKPHPVFGRCPGRAGEETGDNLTQRETIGPVDSLSKNRQ
jgi:hypothetical protein